MATDITLHEASIAFLEHLKAQGKHERTLYTYGQDLKQIQSYFGTERPLSNILLAHVGRFYKSDVMLKLPNGNPRAEHTVRKTRRVYRQLMLWALEQGYIDTLPLLKEDLVKGRKAEVNAEEDKPGEC